VAFQFVQLRFAEWRPAVSQFVEASAALALVARTQGWLCLDQRKNLACPAEGCWAVGIRVEIVESGTEQVELGWEPFATVGLAVGKVEPVASWLRPGWLVGPNRETDFEVRWEVHLFVEAAGRVGWLPDIGTSPAELDKVRTGLTGPLVLRHDVEKPFAKCGLKNLRVQLTGYGLNSYNQWMPESQSTQSTNSIARIGGSLFSTGYLNTPR